MLRNILLQLHQNAVKATKLHQIRCLVQTADTSSKASEYELQSQHIEEAVKVEPTLAAVSQEMWQKAHQTFANHGLNTPKFLQIVTGNPKVLMRSPQKIIEALEFWRSCQFGEYHLFLLITKYPSLMDVNDGRQLMKQIAFLKSYAGTHKNVWKLLMSCPSLIEQSPERIEAKLKYMKDVMRIEITEIIKSEALEKSLEDIKCRHVFLERLGLFKPRPLRADPNEPTTNPRLYKITDMSDKSFATKLCHVSFAEFETFKELYAREMAREEMEENEYDDDDFDEDEEDMKSAPSGKANYRKSDKRKQPRLQWRSQ